jgi:glycosyltransferase involved in cell wall biosynthesis
MKVSVLMGAFNARAYLEQAITSLLAQTYTSMEILISDDRSSDDTRTLIDAYAQKDSRIKTFHNQTNLGIARTRNRLFKCATGELITQLDADDWLSPETIEAQVDFLNKKDAEAVGVNYFKVDVDGSIKINTSGKSSCFVTKEAIHDLPFWPTNIMFTRRLLQLIGGYHAFFEDKSCYEDLYWVYNMLEVAPVGFIPKPLYFLRHNPSSATKTLDFTKLAGRELVNELIRQRQATGSDWLTSGEYDKPNAYISSFMRDEAWKGELYRTYAAIKIDERRYAEAAVFLKEAVAARPLHAENVRTFVYLLRSVLAEYQGRLQVFKKE